MKTKLLCSLAAIFCCLSYCGAQPEFPAPLVSVEEALTIAKAHMSQQHIDVSHHYIDSIQFERKPADREGKFWLITWLDNRYANGAAIKGGQLYVRVYLDKTVKVFYGE